MKKMKKATTILALSALSLSMLTACGPKEEKETAGKDSKKAYDLLVWEDNNKKIEGLKDAVTAFEKENNVKIKVEEIQTTEQVEQLRLDGASGKGPDVITLPHDKIGGAAVEGLLAEVQVDQSVVDTFTESSIKALTYEGKLYGLPKAVETPVFVYNKALMSEAPATMDEVYAFAKENTKDGQYGFLAKWDDFYYAYGAVGGSGGYVFGDKDGVPNPQDLGLQTAGAIEGAEFIQKWYSEELFPKGIIGDNGGSALDSLFTEGKVAAVMTGPWSFQAYADAGIDIGVAPMPKMPNGKPVQTFQGVKGWHVTSTSKNQELATKFVEFITNADNAKIRFEKTEEIPPVVSLMESDLIKNNEKANAVAQQSIDALPMPNIPEMQEVWDPMKTALQLIATGKSKPKDALADATKQIEGNIKANHSGK